MDRKNHFIISAEEFQLIFSMFLCLIFKLKSHSGTSFALYFAFAEYRTDDSNSPAERTLSSAGLYCAARLLISGNYWYAGLTVWGELISRQPCTVPLDCWSAEITGTLDSQSSGELFSRRPCTMPLDCWSTEMTGMLDSQSAESTDQRISYS